MVIIVKVGEALSAGVTFRAYGQHLYLSERLPPEVIICPPLAKIPAADLKTEKGSARPQMKTPGSFIWQPDDPDASHGQGDNAKQRKPTAWKKQRRLERKHKKRMQKSEFYEI